MVCSRGVVRTVALLSAQQPLSGAARASFSLTVERLRNRSRAADFAQEQDFYLKVAAIVGHSQHVSDVDLARSLGGLSVALDPAETASACGQGSRLEESGGPKPLVHPHREHDLRVDSCFMVYGRQFPQARYRPWNETQREINFVCRVLLAQAEAYAGAGAIGTQSHGGQNVRRLDCARGASCAGRDCQSLQVERNYERLAFDVIEINVGSVRHARSVLSVCTSGFDLAQFPFEAISCGRHFLVVAAFEGGKRQFGSLAQADNPRDILGSGTARAFMASAVKHRFQQRPLADIQCADTLRRVNLVAGNCQEVAANLVHINRNLARTLNRIGVEVHVGCGSNFSDLFDRLHYTSFVVGRHDRDQLRLWPQGALDVIWIDTPPTVNWNTGDLASFLFEMFARVHHGVMLDGRSDDVIARLG